MNDQQATNPAANSGMTPEQQMLNEILVNSRKTKNYMKWQLIITVALVVLPLLATVFVIPFALNSLSSAYGTGEASSIKSLLQ